jgi:inorganic pyrophosphatase
MSREEEPIVHRWSLLPCAIAWCLFTACAHSGSLGLSTELDAERNWLDGYAGVRDDGLVNIVVEIPAGTNQKWEVSESGDLLRWEIEDGRPRVVQYLAYPANYGMLPRTLLPRSQGGDGDPLDALVLGPRLERGEVVAARPVGVLRLTDDGERDDKIIAVPEAGPLSDVSSLAELDEQYPGASSIIEIWFTHYKGHERLESRGFRGPSYALEIIREASSAFEARRADAGP